MEKKPPTTKRSRASNAKTRTGCSTCKSRHIKCDESRPECLRCKKTGLKCGGYETFTRTPSGYEGSSSALMQHISTLPSQTPQEHRSWEFFCLQVAPELSGHFYRRLWTEIVLQHCCQEPAIFHGVLALSAIAESGILSDSSPRPENKALNDEFALGSYNRSIRLLRHELDNPRSIRIPLIACLVFICTDFLRQETELAFMHIESGIQLLNSWQTVQIDSGSQSSDFRFVRAVFTPKFSSLGLLGCLYGRSSFFNLIASLHLLRSSVEDTETPLTSLEDAAMSQSLLIGETIQLVRGIGDSKFRGKRKADVTLRQQVLIVKMDHWKCKLDSFFAKTSIQESTEKAMSIVHANYISVRVWLEAFLSPLESVYDSYRRHFEDIVRLMEFAMNDTPNIGEPIQIQPHLSRPNRFLFECCILPPLQFVAWRCRWPHIRRKALALMHALRRREIIIDSGHSYDLFERLMQLEESHLNLAPGQLPRENELPPETARIHHIRMPPLPPTPDGKPVNFLSKPSNWQIGWYVQSHYLRISDIEPCRWSDITNYSSTKN